MIYRKLKRTWSNNHAHYIPRFKEVFPELKKVSSEDLCDRFIDLNMEFYYQEQASVSFFIRLTLPFALAFICLLFVFLPFAFLITGKWGYSLNKILWVQNWLQSLKLM